MLDKQSQQRLQQRFFAKVAIINDADSCWEWTAFKDRDGYGRTSIQNVAISAHRVAYVLENGPIPVGMSVLHRCDNPGCVRSSHLFLGTQSDNMRDRFQKGRYKTKNQDATPRGVGDLSAAEINQIYTLRQQGERYTRVAQIFRVSIFTVCRIEQGRI